MFYHIFQLPSSKKISVTKKETFLVIRHVYQTPHLNAKLRFIFFLYSRAVRFPTLKTHKEVPALEDRITLTGIALTAISQLGNCRISCKKVLTR